MNEKQLKRELQSLVNTYGADEVQNALNGVEPFKSFIREQNKLTRLIDRREHARSYRDVRKRETFLKSTWIEVLIYRSERNGTFSAHALPESMLTERVALYEEPLEQLDDFILWLKQRGFIDRPVKLFNDQWTVELVHAERYSFRESEIYAGTPWDKPWRTNAS